MRTNKNTSKIILAVTVAILATMISYSVFSNMQNELSEQKKLIETMQDGKTGEVETYTYAVAATDLKAGEIVAEQDVDFQNFAVANINAFDNRSEVVNKVLLQDIAVGAPFTSAHIAKISNDNVSLRDGCGALTLPADGFQGKSKSMSAGTSVDIYSASKENPWVLENVRILSFESDKQPTGKDAVVSPTDILNASSITFEVASGDISDFISNVSQGKLVLVTRAAGAKKRVFRKPKISNNYSSSYPSIPNLPASVPISDMSGLPEPMQPMVPQKSVELIEANVKSKVTFD